MKKLVAKIKNNGEVLMSLDNDIVLVSFGALDRGNVSEITNWGCFSNTGEVQFLDKTNAFSDIISSFPNSTVCIYYSSKDVKKLLATFLIDDYEIDEEQKKVTLRLKDRLIDWQKQNVEEYYEFEEKHLSNIWGDIYSSEMGVSDQALAKMSESNINISYLRKGTKWANADKVCQASMARCFCDNEGKPIISDENSSYVGSIIIEPRNILSIENKTPNRKTKVVDVSLSAYNYTKRWDEPLSNDVSFSWYRTRGTASPGLDAIGDENYIIADWAEDFSTKKEHYEEGYNIVVTGASAWGDITFPEHYFRIKSPDISVVVSKSSNENANITTEYRSSSVEKVESLGHEYYDVNSDGVTTDIIVNGNNDGAKITLTDMHAIDKYNYALNNEHLVGHFVITNGTLNWLGDYFTEDGEQTFGSETEYATKLQTNELIQVESTFGDKALAQHIIDSVQEKYSNGVECVVMEVTPSDYEGTGDMIISQNSNKPLFEKYDVVYPYVVRNGIKQPYSIRKDGTPKPFKVMGIEYSYKGLLRQKLHLQEHTTESSYNIKKPNLMIIETAYEDVAVCWAFKNLNPLTEYNISWSVRKDVLEFMQITTNVDGFPCYYVLEYNDLGFSYHPKYTAADDILNTKTKATSDSNGDLIIGIGFSESNHDYTLSMFDSNTNNIIAWLD